MKHTIATITCCLLMSNTVLADSLEMADTVLTDNIVMIDTVLQDSVEITDTVLQDSVEMGGTDLQDSVKMADLMRSNGKIYVVVAVIALIFIGLMGYLYRIDKRVKKLEN